MTTIHTPLIADVVIPAVLLGITAAMLVFSRRATRARRRLGVSLGAGTAAGGVLAAVVGRARHAALAAVPSPGHVSAAVSLGTGFAATALTVTVLAFILLTVAARRRATARDLAVQRQAARELAGVRPARRAVARGGGDRDLAGVRPERRRRAVARGGDLR